MPSTSSWVSVRNCEVVVLSGSITCGWTAGHAGDPGDLGDLGGAEQPARGEARAHPHALAGHRDLAEDEAVAALDEARDPLGHRPERHQARHAHRDAEHVNR